MDPRSIADQNKLEDENFQVFNYSLEIYNGWLIDFEKFFGIETPDKGTDLSLKWERIRVF